MMKFLLLMLIAVFLSVDLDSKNTSRKARPALPYLGHDP